MKDVFEKLKPILLLLSMSLVSFGIVWVVNQFKYSNKPVVVSAPVLQSPPEQQEESMPLMEDTSELLEVPQENEYDEYVLSELDESEVKGAAQCKNIETFTDIKSSSICIREFEDKGEVDFGDGEAVSGTLVRKEAQVELTKVTVPLELYSGVEVADSNRLITKETPTLKPAGEQVDDLAGNVQMPPNVQVDTKLTWDEEKPFKSSYGVGFASAPDTFTESGDVGVETELGNQCDDDMYNNVSNVNPSRSNAIFKFLNNTYYRFPNEVLDITEETAAEECSDSDTFIVWDKREYIACRASLVTQTVEFFKDIVLWWEIYNNKRYCEANPDECMDTEDIIVMMTSTFGSDTDCTDEEESACTNAYMNTRNRVVLPPNADMGGKQYFLTPCKAKVKGARGEQDVQCAWDMSHLFKERKVNEYDDTPNTEFTPSEEEYEEFLKEEVQGTRGTERLIQ